MRPTTRSSAFALPGRSCGSHRDRPGPASRRALPEWPGLRRAWRRYRATAPPPGGASLSVQMPASRQDQTSKSSWATVWSSALCSLRMLSPGCARFRGFPGQSRVRFRACGGSGARAGTAGHRRSVSATGSYGHLRDRLADDRVLQRRSGILTPHERAVVGARAPGTSTGSSPRESNSRRWPGRYCTRHLRRALSLVEIPRTANRPVEGVGVGGAE